MQKDNKEQQAWRKFAFDVFARITGWIAGPIIIALYAGKWLDQKYGTEPWLFLALIAAAFAISCIAIVKTSFKYINQIEQTSEKDKSEENKKEQV